MPRFVVLVTLICSAASARAAPPDAQCVPPPIGKVPFSSGERIEYELDTLGANVGGFSLNLTSGRRPNIWTVIARGKTGNLAASFVPVEGTAEAYLDSSVATRRYVEDAVEGKMHWSMEVALPPTGPKLPVHATRQGSKDDYATTALPDTRDILGALYAVRTLDLSDNASFCMPVFGARRVWELKAKVAGHESIRTPMGSFHTAHLVGTATRIEAPYSTRNVELWVTDDASRIPVAALGVMQNKVIRAQIAQYTPGRKTTQRHELRQ